MKLFKTILLLIAVLAGFTNVLWAQDSAAVKKKAPKETPYEKLFKNKTVKTEKGLITLHKTAGKVYFELPVKLLNQYMLLGSVAAAVSNGEDAAAGEQAHDPLCIYFTQIDSVIHMREQDFSMQAATKDAGLQEAIDKNNISPILASFKILAVNPDSNAVVFDATSFFVDGNEQLDPFMSVGGLRSRKTSFKSATSLLADIAAYEDNVTISSYLSYGITATFFGFITDQDRPSTVLMKRTLLLLPKETMRPRLGDPRIGIFTSAFQTYSGQDNGMKEVHYAHRWRLEPKDIKAFKRGRLTEPVQPIVFYIDDRFPAQWIPHIRQGVENWNKAYEKLGFKNAIVTRMYPKNDSSFDPNNIRYNCIKYAPTLTQNAMGPSWVDPRTGEILNASVYVYHGIIDVLSEWLFIQTAPADKRVRTMNIPEPIIGKGIEYIISHETGHCLGLMHNMGASSAFPVDSLRSPTFTQRYGTTPSIMDYARFNFVAQPGDKERGVKLTPPDLGVYDYYAIKWLYTPLYKAHTPEEEVPVLDKWISDKIKDPMYRYGKQQLYGTVDPSAQTEDLGDDQVKATAYAIKNLQYLMEHTSDWVAGEDRDFSFRRKVNFSIINIQFYWYWMHVLSNVGGVYLHEKYEGDPFPAYESVPRDVQKRSVHFLLESLEHLDWMNNKKFEDNIDAINGDASNYIRTVLFPYMMRWVANVGLSEARSVDTLPYTQAACVADVFDYLWDSTLAGKAPSPEKLSMQEIFVQLLIRNAGVISNKAAKATGLQSLQPEEMALYQMDEAARRHSLLKDVSPLQEIGAANPLLQQEEVQGFGFQPRLKYQSEDITHIYYEWLLRNKTILEQVIARQEGETKTRYEYLLLQINRALKL